MSRFNPLRRLGVPAGGLARAQSRERRKIAARPARAYLLAKIREPACRDGGPHAVHELLVIGEIDRGNQHRGEDLVRLDEMVQIGARVIARRGASAFGIERARTLGMARVLEIDGAKAAESQAMAAVARRQHAIEHVDATRYGLEQIL